MIEVVEYADIREAYYVKGWSVRKIAKTFGLSRNTVKKYIQDGAFPEYHSYVEKERPVLGSFEEKIDEIILADLEKNPKERFTSHTLFEHLSGEYGYEGAESTLRRFFCQRRREILGSANVTVPLDHPPNGEAQVDWIEDIPVVINGEKVNVQGFCLRLNYSGRKFVKVYRTMEMECWLDGHRSAFEFLGGVPPRITYDNPRVAVTKVLKGRKRVENNTFLGFRGYYSFGSLYCMRRTPEEKGGVENGVGYVRRNFFVPTLEGKDIDDINSQMLAVCLREDNRIAKRRQDSISAAFEREKRSLLPLPQKPYECCRLLPVKIASRTSTFGFENNRYSVPTKYVCQTLMLKVYPNHLEVCRDDEVVAVHKRLHGVVYQDCLDPMHYLPCLEKKPALLDHGKPFVNWQLPEEFARYLEDLRTPYGEKARREYIRVLLQLQYYSVQDVASAIGQALRAGTRDPDAVISLLKVREHKLTTLDSTGDFKTIPFPERIRILQPDCATFDRLLDLEVEEVAA